MEAGGFILPLKATFTTSLILFPTPNSLSCDADLLAPIIQIADSQYSNDCKLLKEKVRRQVAHRPPDPGLGPKASPSIYAGESKG
jgi:hypothetical protein